MENLTIFEVLLITHLIMDFIFQRGWEAARKHGELTPLIIHCFIYTIGFIPAFWFFEINFLWLILIFASHVIIDQQWFLLWFLEKFKGFKKEKFSETLWILLLVGVDQILHAAVLVFIILFN